MSKTTLLTILLLLPIFIFAHKRDSLQYLSGEEKAVALFTIGNSFYPNNNDSALSYINQAINEYDKLNDETGKISSYGLLSAIYCDYGLYDTAISLAYQVISLTEANQDRRVYIAYLGLANIYNNLGQYQKARDFYLKAVDGTYLPAKLAAFANLGLFYLHNQKLDSAAYYFNQALEDYNKSDTSLNINKFNIASIKLNLAEVSCKKGDIESGIDLLKESLRIFQNLDNTISIINTYTLLGQKEFQLQNRHQALQYYKKAERMADSLQLRQNQKDIYLHLSDFYSALANYEKAFLYYQKYHAIYDSIIIEINNNNIAKLDAQYAFKEKTARIQALQKEKNNIIILSVIIIIVLLAFAFIIILYLHKRRLVLRNAKAIAEMKANLAQEKLQRIKSDLHKKSAFIEDLEREMSELSSSTDKELYEEKKHRLRKTRILTDNDWIEYNHSFHELYPKFFSKLEQFQELSTGDKRQLIFIKLELKPKEIAYLMGISPEGVKRAQQRLSKKLGLANSGELSAFIEKL